MYLHVSALVGYKVGHLISCCRNNKVVRVPLVVLDLHGKLRLSCFLYYDMCLQVNFPALAV